MDGKRTVRRGGRTAKIVQGDAALDERREEIQELSGYCEQARSIIADAKGEMLVAQLPDILDRIAAKGGRRKVLIFTEYRPTQVYLAEILAQAGYEGGIILLNGSNDDPVSADIYADWLRRHQGSRKVSGSRAVDMKTAIVEAFAREDQTILIATEAGAEGLNLQFCSAVINYDLPWNPQRIEQRIARVHR